MRLNIKEQGIVKFSQRFLLWQRRFRNPAEFLIFVGKFLVAVAAFASRNVATRGIEFGCEVAVQVAILGTGLLQSIH